MPGTFTQLYIQVVFAVKGRQCLIDSSWEEKLYKYISGIVTNKGQKMLAINGMPDHLHFYFGMKPTCCISDLVREVKKSSNEFIQENKFSKYKFQWQEGYGAFSYRHSDLDTMVKYVMNQKVHHQTKSFRIEYLEILNEFGIEFKDEYLFEWYD